jgi:hypothetical protein
LLRWLFDVFGSKGEGVMFLRFVALKLVDLRYLDGLQVAASRCTPMSTYLDYLVLGGARLFL